MNLLTIEARTNSKRLPGKVLLELNKKSLIEVIVEKCKNINSIDKLVVATTTSKKDDMFCKYLRKKNISFYRGSEENVWLRLVNCCKQYKADNLVKLTGDNPFIDTELINEAFGIFKNIDNLDILCVCDKRSVPIGLDFEILNTKNFIKSYSNNRDDYDKEHATTFLKKYFQKFDFFPKRVIPKNFINDLELTIDNIEDLNFARKIIQISGKDILDLNINDLYNLYLDFGLKHNSKRKWDKGLI